MKLDINFQVQGRFILIVILSYDCSFRVISTFKFSETVLFTYGCPVFGPKASTFSTFLLWYAIVFTVPVPVLLWTWHLIMNQISKVQFPIIINWTLRTASSLNSLNLKHAGSQQGPQDFTIHTSDSRLPTLVCTLLK